MTLFIKKIDQIGTLSGIGYIFYSVAIAGLGFQTLYNGDFPYMMIPPKHSWIPGIVVISYLSGILLILAGASIIFKIKPRSASFWLGSVLLLIFCFYYLPYEFLTSSKYMHLLEWDSACKELALSGGAFILAGCFADKNENVKTGLPDNLTRFGPILFSLPLILFGMLHLLYAKDVLTYAPAWVPRQVVWSYIPGMVLISSGVSIIFKIKRVFFTALLGTMIFTWFIVLHIPKVIAATGAEFRGELTSAFLALAYSGTAFVIAGIIKE